MYLQPEIPSKRSGYKVPENREAAHHNIDRLDVESTDKEVSLYDYGRREQDALREFQRALKLWPQFPSAHVLVGAAAFALGGLVGGGGDERDTAPEQVLPIVAQEEADATDAGAAAAAVAAA